MVTLQQEQFTLGEEITNAILHGIGVVLSITALVILIIYAVSVGTVWHVVSFSIYGSTLILLYLSSTLYHSLPNGKAKYVFSIFDHAAIYLLIAGTYTPMTLLVLRGPWGWTLLSIVWIMAICGVVFKSLFVDRFHKISTGIYILMGWLLLVAIQPIWEGLNTTSLIFLILGGVFYTSGTLFYHAWNMKYHHAVWHVFVLLGSICHFFMFLFLLPG